jgi:preprotein translocase subunit YajC
MKNRIALSFVFASVLVCSGAFAQAPVGQAPAAVAPAAPAVVAPGQPAVEVQAAPAGTAAQVPGAAAVSQPGGMLGMALPFIIMLGIMYFLMIRPQQKRMKEHQNLLSGLKNGDEVITSAGILGTIAGMSEKVVTLEVSKNVQLKVLKSQVNQVVKGPIQDLQANS